MGESERVAIEKFLKEGLLFHATVPEQLDWGLTLAQLRALLRERGLKLSGKKFEIVERLCQADPSAAGKAGAGALREAAERWIEWRCASMEGASAAALRRTGAEGVLLRCSEGGLRLVCEYTAIEREMGRKAIDALRGRDSDLAISIVAAFEDQLNFPWPPMGGPPEVRIEIARDEIRLAFSARPKILSGINEDAMECLRFMEAVRCLLGLCRGRTEGKLFIPDTQAIESLKTGLRMGNQAALSMVYVHVKFQRNMEVWKRMGVVARIGLLSVRDRDSCPVCIGLHGREWPIDEVPELPYQYCTSERGCICCAIPRVTSR